MSAVISCLLAGLVAASSSPGSPVARPAEEGWAVHYEPGLMREVLRVRQRQGLVPYGVRYDGLASTTDFANIGKRVWVSLRSPRTGRWSAPLRLLVVDCSAPADRARHIRSGLVVEVDFATARRTGWGWDGRRGEGKARARVVRIEP